MDELRVKNLLFQGYTICEIAKIMEVQAATISGIKKQLNLPTAKIIKQINEHPSFKDEFIKLYNSTDDLKIIHTYLNNHPLFYRKTSMEKRIGEIRTLLSLSPKMSENVYATDYDRIRGYMIRNSKYMSKRRNIYFDLTYTDFEIPEYCPILNIKLKYMYEGDGNSPEHATLDRIDNNKGYIKGNVIVISRLANAMKNQADFNQLRLFSLNMHKLINHYEKQGALGSITDVFGETSLKLSLDC